MWWPGAPGEKTHPYVSLCCDGTETPPRTRGPPGLHLPDLSIRVEADPVAVAPEGSPNAQVPAVLQDDVGEPGFLGERDQKGHVAWRVAGKWLGKDKPIKSPQKARVARNTMWDTA